jgi:hypothetical protein
VLFPNAIVFFSVFVIQGASEESAGNKAPQNEHTPGAANMASCPLCFSVSESHRIYDRYDTPSFFLSCEVEWDYTVKKIGFSGAISANCKKAKKFYSACSHKKEVQLTDNIVMFAEGFQIQLFFVAPKPG